MDKRVIDNFRGEYFFLSNFYSSNVTLEGITYHNNEAAFQAQKTLDFDERVKFSSYDPSTAKRMGRSIALRPDWEDVKYYMMYRACRNKFLQNPDLAKRLRNTGDAILMEGNNWGDVIWGVCNGVGENWLGKILMLVRSELISLDTPMFEVN